VSDAEGKPAEARFVGSDRQTNLTVLKLSRPAGDPVRPAEADRPDDGALVLFITPHDGAERLGVWTGPARDYAVVFSIDGRCAGVARLGQFLSARACRLVAQQIIRHGSVPRATLGVIITQMPAGSAGAPEGLAGGSAARLRVDQVIAGSAADAAGIREGDFLLTLAGEPATDIPTLAAAIAARTGPTEVRLLRGGNVVTVSVDLRQR
jgi:S1-C subfamily serine protease